MANFNIEQALSEVKDSSTKQLIEFLLSENNKKSQEIITLKNELCALEQRITLQERYSSKDYLIFENVPLDGKEFLPTFITRFLSEYMNFLTNPENFKPCHVLGRGQKNTPPAIIVKFAYFQEKNEIYSRKKMLWGVTNKINGRQRFIKERLPPKDKELQVYANDRNLVTRTENCQVQLLIENNGIRKSIDVNSAKTIDDNMAIAVQKNRKADCQWVPKKLLVPNNITQCNWQLKIKL